MLNFYQKQIQELNQKKMIFSAFHRGGSTLFNEVVLQLIKLLETYETHLAPKDYRLTKDEKRLGAFFYFRCADLENRELSLEEKLASLKAKPSKYYSIFRISTDEPVEVMEELIRTRNTKNVLLMRDLRDCMCSGYYSFNLLHGLGLDDPNHKKDYEMGIDRYVLEKMLPKYQHALKVLRRLQSSENLVILRYEDMVTQPLEFFRTLSNLIGLTDCQRKIAWSLVRRKFDYEDITYNPRSHKRQVFPGNYRKELKPSTINSINQELGHYLAEYYSDSL